jgi:hypothetical protein
MSAPAAVQLHLNRRIGWGLYGTVTAVVFVLVVVGTVFNVQNGRFWIAAVLALVGLAMTAFLVVVTRAMVVPGLTVTASGISGRLAQGGPIDAPWDAVTIDADEEDRTEDPAHSSIRLTAGERSVSINPRSWVGFTDFVVLVVGTPAARSRMTPAAKLELVRLFQLQR